MSKITVLTAIYDLRTSPFHFDFVTFMAIADALRSDKGCTILDVIIIPDRGSGLHSDDHMHSNQFTDDHADWRMSNIFLPAIGLVPSCGGFTICMSRDHATEILESITDPVYPENYDINTPPKEYWTDFEATLLANIGIEFPGFQAPKQALGYVNQWLDKRAAGRKTISITLREGYHGSSKNSDVNTWLQFAKSLDPEIYFVVFLPDIERALDAKREDISKFTIFPDAVFNLLIRMAFYERCYLCLFTSCGPISLCYYNGATRFINFKSVPPESYNDAVPFPITMGLDVGDDQPWSTPYQKKIEEPEEFGLISEQFNKMTALIESNKSEAFSRLPLKQKNISIEILARVSKYLTKNSNSSRSVLICQKYLERHPDTDGVVGIMIRADLKTSHADKDILATSRNIYMAQKNTAKPSTELNWALIKVDAALGGQQSLDKVIQLANQGIKVPKNSKLLRTVPLKLAVCYIRQQHFDKAQRIVEAADTAERTQETLFMLGMIYESTGQLENALTAYLELEETGMVDPRIYNSLITISKALGNPAKAAHYLEISLELKIQ